MLLGRDAARSCAGVTSILHMTSVARGVVWTRKKGVRHVGFETAREGSKRQMEARARSSSNAKTDDAVLSGFSSCASRCYPAACLSSSSVLLLLPRPHHHPSRRQQLPDERSERSSVPSLCSNLHSKHGIVITVLPWSHSGLE